MRLVPLGNFCNFHLNWLFSFGVDEGELRVFIVKVVEGAVVFGSNYFVKGLPDLVISSFDFGEEWFERLDDHNVLEVVKLVD